MDLINEIRNLLLLTRNKDSSKVDVSKKLSSILVNNSNGVMKLIEASLDVDPSSQKATTHNQRCQAIATIVSRMPHLDTSEDIYFSKLVPQLYQLLKVELPHEDRFEVGEKLWKTAAFIANGLYGRNPDLTRQTFLSPLCECLKNGEAVCDVTGVQLSINDVILIIHRLLICKFPPSPFDAVFPNLFFIRTKISRTQAHLKPVLDTIITENLSRKSAVYLLDSCLFENLSLFETTDRNLLEMVDDCTQVLLSYCKNLRKAFIVDFFMLLIERLSSSSSTCPASSLLLYALIDSFQEPVSTSILEMPSKAIQFVVTTLERISQAPSRNDNIMEKATSSDELIPTESEEADNVRLISLNFSLQIVNQLLKKTTELHVQDISLLAQSKTSLQVLESDLEVDDEIRRVAKDLRIQIEQLTTSTCVKPESADSVEYQNATKDLNDETFCVRAHGLITLKRLILAKNPVALQDLKKIGLLLEASLSDPESYIYLAAIKTLAALAIVKTEETLPLLCSAFLDSHRTVQERVNVGEVLVHLSKSLGDMIPHYANRFLHCFLLGAKDEDPVIRISSLSNIGQICGTLKFGIQPYLVEILNCVQALLETDKSLEVKRASVMLIHLMLNGVDKDCITAIQDGIVSLHRLVKRVYANALDDVLKLHAQLAIEQINRIAKELLLPTEKTTIRKIEIL